MPEKIDLSSLREGDAVLVRGVIVTTEPYLSASFDGECMPVEPHQIVSVEPRPLKVGDRVTAMAGWDGKILCIFDDFAWVDGGNVGPKTVHLTQLDPA